MLPNWFIYAGTGVKINTRNKEDFKIGNIYSMTYLAGYSNIVRKTTATFSAGLKSDIYQKNRNHGIPQKFSGGGELSLVYGMQWTVWKTKFNLFLQHPVYQYLAAGTMKSPVTIQTAIDFVF